jgi:starch-binding outer membrane protein, SusD/RagB family
MSHNKCKILNKIKIIGQMKNINIVLFLLLASILGACEDFLDQQPESSIGAETYFQNDAEVESGVIACYDGIQEQYNETYSFVLMEVRSDNTTTVEHEGDFDLVDTFKDGPSNSVIADFWTSCYSTIFRTNTVLANLDNVATESKKDQFEGEARFIRALTYFNLTRLFGEVPLVTSIVYEGDAEAYSKDAVSDVYSAITNDLQIASSKLPTFYGDKDLGRATSGAAKGLLAKVYLTLKDYPKAESQLISLMGTDYSYEIINNYADVFYSEMNNEILFAARYESGVGGEGQDFSYQMTRLGGIVRGNNPTDDLIAAYETGDLRYNVSVTSDLMCGKYLSEASAGDAGNDWIILRYADIFLMYAEVQNELNGPTQAAIDAVNKIRERAGLTLFSLAGFNQETLRKAIAKERRIELAMEGHRWFDLLRTGKAVEVMSAHGLSLGFSVDNFRTLFPLPQREIDVSDGALVQNPDYL